MSRFLLGLTLLVWLAGASVLAQAPDIRNPSLDTETPEGALITDAAMSEDTDQRLTMYESFIQKYPNDQNIGFVYLQLQSLYLDKEQYDKAAEVGQKLTAIVPNDLEVRHSTIRALEQTDKYDALLKFALETKAIADPEAAKPKPEESEYAQGVVQYVEYSLYTTALRAKDAKDKIALANALVKNYPQGQYVNQVWAQLVAAYQQAGDYENMAVVMKAAVETDPTNETYLYTLAESALSKGSHEEAVKYGEQVLKAVEGKPKPENVSDADWTKQKTLFTAYGNYVLGKTFVSQNKFREGRAALLKAVDPLKEQGGTNYGILAYFLGICYVKLDVGGDNIQAATQWMGTAAGIEHPYQQPAKQTLAAIKKAQGQ